MLDVAPPSMSNNMHVSLAHSLALLKSNDQLMLFVITVQ